MYDSRTIANYFLYLAHRDGVRITPMKLQKLVYFAHGHYLAITGKPLIRDEIEAWQYGPVIPNLYHSIKRFGSDHITDKSIIQDDHFIEQIPKDLTIKKFLNKIWDIYGNLSAVQLSKMTHEKGGPWERTWSEFSRNVDIPDDLIYDFFKSRME